MSRPAIDRGRRTADVLAAYPLGVLGDLRKSTRQRIEELLAEGRGPKDDTLCFMLGFEDRLTENLRRRSA